jgi:tripartite-type tricarboxylate transporter receptor subunit TctC
MNIARALTASMIAACILAGGASAQTYPDRPITMVVAFPPGGADDAIARTLQDPMQKALHQPIVIEISAAPAA